MNKQLFLLFWGRLYVMSTDPIFTLWFFREASPGPNPNIFSLPGLASILSGPKSWSPLRFRASGSKENSQVPFNTQAEGVGGGGKRMLELGICYEPEDHSIKFLYDSI